MKKIALAILVIMAVSLACRKEDPFVRHAVNLRFSENTVFFDTIFTQVGSSTRTLRVFNPGKENLSIDQIHLARGQQSFYRLNVNGVPSKNISNVELLAGDSITIFIEITSDVGTSLELLYTDSIIFNNAGNIQDVDLVALTKDAHFHYPTDTLLIDRGQGLADLLLPYSFLNCNELWLNDKPHVVYGYILVDSACQLTVDAGTEIHFHSRGGMWVRPGGQLFIDPANAGNIEVNPVLIQGDRLEPAYENIPGQWGGLLGGIFFESGSTGNVIRNAIIKNGTIGIRVDSTGGPTATLQIFDTQITNHSRVGLYGGFGNIEAENLVIGHCGLYGFYALGGRYAFTHCTFGNYFVGGRNTPTIGLFNYFEGPGGVHLTRDLISAEFRNCIVYGNRGVEFSVGFHSNGVLNFAFHNSLIRLSEDPEDGSFTRDDPAKFDNCIFNQDPLFTQTQGFDYSLKLNSPAIDAANATYALEVPLDILKVDRTTMPDIGAYERE